LVIVVGEMVLAVVEGSSALRLEARRIFSCLTMEELGSISDSRVSVLFERAQSFLSLGEQQQLQ
jgi:hypothetical protein